MREGYDGVRLPWACPLILVGQAGDDEGATAKRLGGARPSTVNRLGRNPVA